MPESNKIDSAEQIDVSAIKEPQQPVYKYRGYKYDDLFVPPFNMPDQFRDKENLVEIQVDNETQRHSITDLVLSGIYKTSYRGEDTLKALIVAPNKQGFTLTEGMSIGNKGGVIYQINPDHIVVREIAFLPDENQTRTFVERVMKMRTYSTRVTNDEEPESDVIYLDPKADVILPSVDKFNDAKLKANSANDALNRQQKNTEEPNMPRKFNNKKKS